jgi:glycosidase
MRKIRSWSVLPVLVSLLSFLFTACAVWADPPYLEMFGGNAENRVYHFYIDESAGESNVVQFSFWPNTASTEAQIVTTLNRRDEATLDTPDWNGALNSGYWIAHPMTANGSGGYNLTLYTAKCGSYDVRVRFRNGGGDWQYYGGRNPVINISDVETRDLVVYEMQAHVVNATGNDYNSRGLINMLTNSASRFNVDYLADLGVNCIWLQPFHPIGAHDDCNTGDPGSPYSIKNLFQVAEYLSSEGTREASMRDFTNFVINAESKGVKVIFDVIFNHVATDVEMERDPDNPAQLYSTPNAEMRNVRPQWFSKYVGSHPACQTTKPDWDHGNYQYWLPAENAGQIGPAPADRHDFVWPDAFDLFWGTYPALGNIGDTSDGAWVASDEVKKMTEYYAYFLQYWIEKTGGMAGGFRCDFAQGIPRQAWQYLINKAKSVKPELYFVSESLDGGNIAYRAWKGGFDALNENQLWAIVENYDIKTTDLRSVIDSRKQQFGLALILRGTVNHDQGPWINRKWDGVAMHSVFCAIDGTPQMYQGQELGYDNLGQFSRERVEFGRTIPDIRNWHNMNNLWDNRNNFENGALWHRYKDANLGRSRSVALRLGNQYYVDQVNNWGPHQQIFSVLKYEHEGWDPEHQNAVLALINLRPGTAQAGTFNVNVSAIYLNPTTIYNVKNLASTSPNTYLWPEGRSGADIAANGIYVGFSANKGDEGSIAQFLKIEKQGESGGEAITTLNEPSHWPENGNITSSDAIWINISSEPAGAGDFGAVVYSTDGINWHSKPLNFNSDWSDETRDWWNVNLGSFASSAQIRYAVQVTDKEGTAHWKNNNGENYLATVNQSTGGGGDLWVGNTSTWPPQGEITPHNDLWIDTETSPIAPGQFVNLVYSNSVDGVWQVVPMSWHENVGNNSRWHVNLGNLPGGTVIQFAIQATNDTEEAWDNNNGNDYVRTVNEATGGSVQWVGNTLHMPVVTPDLGAASLSFSGKPQLQLDSLKSGGGYRIYKSTNLLDSTWDLAAEFTGSGTTYDWTDNDNTNDLVFYQVAGVTFPSGGSVYSTDELLIHAESYPTGRAVSATIVYSTSGNNWTSKPMAKIGIQGNNDLWQANLGLFPHGIQVQYAIEFVDDQGAARWDNNGTVNFHVPIRNPDSPDEEPPVLSYSPQNTTTDQPTLDVTLSAIDDFDPDPVIYFTTNGTTPTTTSDIYVTPIHVVDGGGGVDLTIKAFAQDASGNASAITTIEVRVGETFTAGPSKPYSTNPSLGKRVANGAITIDGANSGEWTTNNLIALDMANDDPRSLGDNWTMHEAPIDLTHLWAAWDDNYLYLAWQYVDITDVIDPSNAGSAGGGKISNNDGILQWIVLDTITGQGATNDMWQKFNTWAGPNKPNYQIYLAGSLWQGFISRAQNGVFPVDDGGVNYNTISAAGITAGKGSIYAGGSELWGVGDADQRFDVGAPNRNFMSEGHSGARDSFYEMRVPLSYLGITAAQLELSGIGVMIGAGSASAMDSIPNDSTTLDTHGVESWNSSLEWGDKDTFTVPFARIGK